MPRSEFENYIAISPEGAREPMGSVWAWAKRRGFKYPGVLKAVKDNRPYKGWRFVEDKNFGPPSFEAGATPLQIREQLRNYIGWIASQDAYYAHHPDQRPDVWNAVNLMKAAEQVAKANNIDWGDVGDNRDPEDKALDAVSQILSMPDDFFSMTDEVIAVMEKGIDRAIEDTQAVWEHLDREAKEGPGRKPPPDPKVLAQRAEKFLNLLRRNKRLRSLARNPEPPELEGLLTKPQMRSCHLVRFMLYTGRSDITGKKPADEVYRIGTPTVRMAVEPWLAENGYDFYPGVGMRGPEDVDPTYGNKYPHAHWVGAVIMAPPRHGKTDMTIQRRVLRINLNPRRQAAYIHDNDSFASSRLTAVRRFYDPKTAQGRRNMSLFPERRLAAKGNNSNYLTLASDSPTTNPNLVAFGIHTSQMGINLDDLDGDDLVPSSDTYQPTERIRRLEIWERSWMTRFQGTSGFLYLTGYPQHQDDLLSYYERMAYDSRRTGGVIGIRLWVVKMPVGGPDSDPPFFPIFPELYDDKWLAQKYASMADKTAWASNYMLVPLDERDRLVRNLRLYDEGSEEHAEFVRKGRFFVGLDPALKGDGHGDKAGLVIACVGEVTEMVEQMGLGMSLHSEMQIRIIDEREFHATQHEINETLISIGQMLNIDRVFIEEKGGGSAIMDALANYHGISAVEGYNPPGNKNKEMRLRMVSAMLENSNPAFPAKVLFPGKLAPGVAGGPARLVLDERMSRLGNYIINFASASGLHSLDALTMLLHKTRHFVEVGMIGSFSREATKQELPSDSDRVRVMLRKQIEERNRMRRAGYMRTVVNSSGA